MLENLLSKIAEGDPAAFAAFYEETKSMTYGFALSILRREQDAEDVMQDAFVAVKTHAERYRPQGKPKAWLLTIVRNLAYQRLREKGREGGEEPELSFDPRGDFERRESVSALLMNLGEQERQIVMLHAVAGLKHREIAQLLQLSLSTILSKYHRALKKCRTMYEEGARI